MSPAPSTGLAMAAVAPRALLEEGTSPERGGHPPARQHPAVEGQPGHGPRLRRVLLQEVPELQAGLQLPEGSQLLQRVLGQPGRAQPLTEEGKSCGISLCLGGCSGRPQSSSSA